MISNHERGAVFSLEVSRAGLLRAVPQLYAKATPLAGAEAVLVFNGAQLSLSLNGTVVRLQAAGRWPRQVRVLGNFFRIVGLLPPPEDPIRITLHQDILRIGTTAMRCRRSTPGRRRATSTPRPSAAGSSASESD